MALTPWRLLRTLWMAALVGMGGMAGTALAANDDFLDPAVAFKPTATPTGPQAVALRFDVAPGYHLYRERLAVQAEPGTGVQLDVQSPPGQRQRDPAADQEVETYTGPVALTVALRGLPAQGPGAVTLAVDSQGCADAGLCYPPQRQRWQVRSLDGVVQTVSALDGDGTASPPATAAAAGETGRIEAALQSGSLWQVAVVFGLGGLLLAFTPCVLPMLPILSSIIVGQGHASRGRSFALSVSYSLGMALVYTAFGVAAGLAGEGLAAALQQPPVLIAFALLLVALALSMFGLYELQLPGALQSRLAGASNRLQGGRHLGVFAMGGLSALIVGPCVAAPLAGALVFISQTHDVVIGGLALFALAAGMSVPLLLLGASAGALLPRAGAWMDGVKRCFGFALLALAWWLASPALPRPVLMLTAGAWLLLAAAWLGAFSRLPDGASGWARTRASIAMLMALLGGGEVLGLLAGGRDPWAPLDTLASARADTRAPAPLAFRPVRSVNELESHLRQADGPVLVDFYAEWCVACKEMEHLTLAHPGVQGELGRLRLLRVDVTANSPDDRALLKRFGLFGPPGIAFFDRSGHELANERLVGFEKPEDFLQRLQRIGRS